MTIRDYDTFIFSHIPKCGGSSFRKYVIESCVASDIAPERVYAPGFNGIKNNKNISQLEPVELKALRNTDLKVVADHSKFNVHRRYRLGMTKPFYYTIFREPVARFISHYNFFYYKMGYGNCKGVSLNDLDEPKRREIMTTLANLQVNYVANNIKNPINVEHYKLAIYNIERHYACFGLLKDMEKSLEILDKYAPEWVQWKKNFPMENKNPGNKGKAEIKPEIVRQIQEINEYDMRLYDFVEKLFYLRYQAYCQDTEYFTPHEVHIENT